MRGYFGIGVEEISKAYNLGNLVRSAHAFGASFFFTLKPGLDASGPEARQACAPVALQAPEAPVQDATEIDMHALKVSDTARSFSHMPYFEYAGAGALNLPRGCALVGVELTPDAIDLPKFKHPLQAAYILGPEFGSLSPEVQRRCAHIVKIPTRFCINVGVAGAIVMYDRILHLGGARPRGAAAQKTPPPFGSRGGRR